MRQAIDEATDESTRTPVFLFRRTRQILAGSGEAMVMPSTRSLYRLFGRLQAGRHATGSAKTRRSLAARPEGPFGQAAAIAPGDLMQIDSTPLDVLVRLQSAHPPPASRGTTGLRQAAPARALLRPSVRFSRGLTVGCVLSR
jgi:hypothetical protein